MFVPRTLSAKEADAPKWVLQTRGFREWLVSFGFPFQCQPKEGPPWNKAALCKAWLDPRSTRTRAVCEDLIRKLGQVLDCCPDLGDEGRRHIKGIKRTLEGQRGGDGRWNEADCQLPAHSRNAGVYVCTYARTYACIKIYTHTVTYSYRCFLVMATVVAGISCSFPKSAVPGEWERSRRPGLTFRHLESLAQVPGAGVPGCRARVAFDG